MESKQVCTPVLGLEPWTSVDRVDRTVEKNGSRNGGSCDKKVPLAAFKEDSGGGGLLRARKPPRNVRR